MVRRSSSAAVSVRSFFGHSDERAPCGGTMPDSSPLTSGYGSVLIAVTPHATTEPHANEPNRPSVHLDVRGPDDRRPAGDLAFDPRPEFGRAVADRFHQLSGQLLADRFRPNCFYHFALNLRNDTLRRVRRRDHAHPGIGFH